MNQSIGHHPFQNSLGVLYQHCAGVGVLRRSCQGRTYAIRLPATLNLLVQFGFKKCNKTICIAVHWVTIYAQCHAGVNMTH